jgi:hypothetical protein
MLGGGGKEGGWLSSHEYTNIARKGRQIERLELYRWIARQSLR